MVIFALFPILYVLDVQVNMNYVPPPIQTFFLPSLRLLLFCSECIHIHYGGVIASANAEKGVHRNWWLAGWGERKHSSTHGGLVPFKCIKRPLRRLWIIANNSAFLKKVLVPALQ